MVEQNQLLRAGLAGESGGLKPGAVSPAAMAIVFGGCILRVADQDVGVLRVFKQNGIELGKAGVRNRSHRPRLTFRIESDTLRLPADG